MADDAFLETTAGDYKHFLLVEGAPRSQAEYVMAAVRAHFPRHSGKSGVGLPRVEDLLPLVRGRTSEGLKLWSAASMPLDRDTMPKLMTFDDTVVLDHPRWLGPPVGRAKLVKKPCDFLRGDVPKRSLENRKLMQRPRFLEGTSGDVSARRRPLLEVMAWGRWRSQDSVRRYAKV